MRRLAALLIAGALVAPAMAAPPPPPPPPMPPRPAAQPMAPPSNAGPAQIRADLSGLNADQRQPMQVCLNEGARLAGTGGATQFTLVGVDSIEQGNGGWRFRYRAIRSNSGGERHSVDYCRATPTKIIEYTRN